MTIKSRLQKLEKQGGKAVEFVIVYMDEGKVSGRHDSGDKHPELIGMTEAELDAHYAGRDDILVVKIVYASQVKK